LSNVVQSPSSVTNYRVATISGLSSVSISVSSAGAVSATGFDTFNTFHTGTVTFEAFNAAGWSVARFTLGVSIQVEIQGGGIIQ